MIYLCSLHSNVTHVMAFFSVGVCVHKHSKSNEVVHISKYSTCEQRPKYIRAFSHNTVSNNKQHMMFELSVVLIVE